MFSRSRELGVGILLFTAGRVSSKLGCRLGDRSKITPPRTIRVVYLSTYLHTYRSVLGPPGTHGHCIVVIRCRAIGSPRLQARGSVVFEAYTERPSPRGRKLSGAVLRTVTTLATCARAEAPFRGVRGPHHGPLGPVPESILRIGRVGTWTAMVCAAQGPVRPGGRAKTLVFVGDMYSRTVRYMRGAARVADTSGGGTAQVKHAAG